MGCSFLAFLLFAKQMAPRGRRWFYLSACGPLLCVAIATLATFLTRIDRDGVKVVGHLKAGVNPLSVNLVDLSGENGSQAARAGIVTGLVALTEAVAIGRSFASLGGYHLDGNSELLACGVMNVAGSLTSCYVTTGSFSRSAVNAAAGAHTAVSNVVMALVLLVVLAALTPLFHYTPSAVLSAIIINAVMGLINVSAAKLIWRVDKLDFLATLGAFFGTLFISVEIGLLIAVCISAVKVLVQITRPNMPRLGRIPGTTVFRNVALYPEAVSEPGILAARFDASIYFANSNYMRERFSAKTPDVILAACLLADQGQDFLRRVVRTILLRWMRLDAELARSAFRCDLHACVALLEACGPQSAGVEWGRMWH
eukprot:jgi/Mesen1/10034/ME000073S09314